MKRQSDGRVESNEVVFHSVEDLLLTCEKNGNDNPPEVGGLSMSPTVSGSMEPDARTGSELGRGSGTGAKGKRTSGKRGGTVSTPNPTPEKASPKPKPLPREDSTCTECGSTMELLLQGKGTSTCGNCRLMLRVHEIDRREQQFKIDQETWEATREKTLSQQQQTLEKKEAESIVWETAIQVQQGVLAAKAQEFEEQLGRERII